MNRIKAIALSLATILISSTAFAEVEKCTLDAGEKFLKIVACQPGAHCGMLIATKSRNLKLRMAINDTLMADDTVCDPYSCYRQISFQNNTDEVKLMTAFAINDRNSPVEVKVNWSH